MHRKTISVSVFNFNDFKCFSVLFLFFFIQSLFDIILLFLKQIEMIEIKGEERKK